MLGATSSGLFALQAICVLFGIVVGHILILSSKFLHEYPEDYLWGGLRSIPYFAAAVVTTELLFGALVILPLLMRLLLRGSVPVAQSLFIAAAAGALTTAIPSSFEKFLSAILPMGRLNSTAARSLFRLLVWLQQITHQQVGRSAQRLLQKDNIDWNFQRPGQWNCGLTAQQAGRVTRIVYEVHKREIAEKRRNPKFLDHYKDIYPGYKFYLVAKHLGRRAVREILHHPPAFPWDGKERRHKEASCGKTRRIGDDPRIRQAVGNGTDIIHDYREGRQKSA